MFENIGEIVLLFWRTLRALPFAWRQRRKIFDQFFEIGNASLLMVCVLSFFIGAVIALQTGPVLVERGLTSAVGGISGLQNTADQAVGGLALNQGVDISQAMLAMDQASLGMQLAVSVRDKAVEAYQSLINMQM
jgi:flagellar hook-basal body complex protein FliE